MQRADALPCVAHSAAPCDGSVGVAPGTMESPESGEKHTLKSERGRDRRIRNLWYSQLHNGFVANLGYVRPCLQRKKKSKEVAWEYQKSSARLKSSGVGLGEKKKKNERREERKGAFLSVVFKEANTDISHK